MMEPIHHPKKTSSDSMLKKLSLLPVSKVTQKPVIHFAHANGMPSKVYQPIFEQLSPYFTVEYIEVLGFDNGADTLKAPRYRVDDHWKRLTKQVIKSVTQLSKKHGVPIIGMGHSLGALCTLQALYKEPNLFSQVVLMDPPLIYGVDNILWHLAKVLSPKQVDKRSPAGISKHRRDHWDSREEASKLFRPKSFFKAFDQRTFDNYIQHGLTELSDGTVTLTIPKSIEVAVFRTNPSLYWLTPNRPPKRPVTLITGEDSLFYKRGFPQKVQKRLSIPYHVHTGGHMFPLEYPDSVANVLIETIATQADSH